MRFQHTVSAFFPSQTLLARLRDLECVIVQMYPPTLGTSLLGQKCPPRIYCGRGGNHIWTATGGYICPSTHPISTAAEGGATVVPIAACHRDTFVLGQMYPHPIRSKPGGISVLGQQYLGQQYPPTHPIRSKLGGYICTRTDVPTHAQQARGSFSSDVSSSESSSTSGGTLDPGST